MPLTEVEINPEEISRLMGLLEPHLKNEKPDVVLIGCLSLALLIQSPSKPTFEQLVAAVLDLSQYAAILAANYQVPTTVN